MTEVAEPLEAGPAPEKVKRRRVQTWELILWSVLLVLAVIVRVIDLDDRPFHHDESQDAYFSYLFRQDPGSYSYNPLLHGPLRFYLTGLMYLLFGDTDFTARLAPVLMGAAMIPMCWGLRPLLGRGAAFATAALLAFGPSFLYFSRFAREDIYVASLTLALIIVIWRFLDRPRKYHPAAILALVALSFATKETTFITVFVMGSFFLVALAIPQTRWQVWGPVREAGLDGWVWAAAAFAGTYTILFTRFLTDPNGFKGIYTGLDYWLGQHDVGRGSEPGGEVFYIVLLSLIEWPMILLGVIGAIWLWRRRPLFSAFLVWDFVLSMGVYTWAGEKFAWLILHPLLPLVLLAGAGLQGIWEARLAWRIVGLSAAAVALLYSGVSSVWVNAVHSADPREFLVSTQSSVQVKEVADQVLALAASRGPNAPPLPVAVDSAEGATFPYAWYFRHLATQYPNLQDAATQLPPDAEVLVLTENSRARFQQALDAGYDGRQFDFRVWWVREYGQLRPGNALKYMLTRDTWNPTGGMKQWLYTRR